MSATNRRERQATGNSAAADRLRSFAERIVRLREDLKEIQAGIKEVKAEAGFEGFDKKALMVVVARMEETREERDARIEAEAVAEVYLASLGMLDGTPLGDAARRRFDPITDPEEQDDDRDPGDGDAPYRAPAEPEPPAGRAPAGAMGEHEIAAAREEGSEAAHAGQKVFANPYVAGDPRRAAWDEGWCRRTGSDGMEIPEAWRRRKKPKPDDEQPGDGAAS